jgi:hypothetical protein
MIMSFVIVMKDDRYKMQNVIKSVENLLHSEILCALLRYYLNHQYTKCFYLECNLYITLRKVKGALIASSDKVIDWDK